MARAMRFSVVVIVREDGDPDEAPDLGVGVNEEPVSLELRQASEWLNAVFLDDVMGVMRLTALRHMGQRTLLAKGL